MANIVVSDDSLTVQLSAIEKAQALHGDVTVPRAAVTAVRVVPDCMTEVHGLRAPGTGIPGRLMVGTFRDHGKTSFAVCHGRGPAVLVELTGQRFDRLLITVDDPEAVAGSLAVREPGR